MRGVAIEPRFESWQAAARELLRAGVAPDDVAWEESTAPTTEAAPGDAQSDGAPPPSAIRVPARFIDLARHVAAHPDPDRWRLLYRILWRLVHESRDLLKSERDPDIGRVLRMEREAARPLAPARPPVAAAPEPLIEEPFPGAGAFVPPGAGLPELQAAAARCQGCALYRHASQTVFGRGPQEARIVLVGEQPGDQEDRQGAPFVGPAGEVLDRALGEVGLSRERLYVTNAVKHFSFVERGRRRIHQTPRSAEIAACRPWVEAELTLIRPEVLVCMGATAARTLIGPEVRIQRDRGRFFTTPWAPRTIATFHPSAVLRGEDDATQARLYAMLVDDLRQVARVA